MPYLWRLPSNWRQAYKTIMRPRLAPVIRASLFALRLLTHGNAVFIAHAHQAVINQGIDVTFRRVNRAAAVVVLLFTKITRLVNCTHMWMCAGTRARACVPL